MISTIGHHTFQLTAAFVHLPLCLSVRRTVTQKPPYLPVCLSACLTACVSVCPAVMGAIKTEGFQHSSRILTDNQNAICHFDR